MEPSSPTTSSSIREQITILTGPNMAGKSTYLRQAAVIVLLAQCGSFVPADQAVVGLVDRIFTRVGAHDDITAGMSTFMVEMTETANILNHATRSSLVILDEVGRGTSTYDGLSIAQAVVEHLHDSPRLGCRTLFATHYHELTALSERLPRVRNRRVEVLEEGETVRFLHRVVPGGADRSYGIHVAALAGLPSGVIARARQVLAELERQRPLEPPDQQLGLPMEMTPDPLRKELEEIEPDTLSPLEALQKLYELRAKLDR
jgi:DNA mismatch repair protein MutS